MQSAVESQVQSAEPQKAPKSQEHPQSHNDEKQRDERAPPPDGSFLHIALYNVSWPAMINRALAPRFHWAYNIAPDEELETTGRLYFVKYFKIDEGVDFLGNRQETRTGDPDHPRVQPGKMSYGQETGRSVSISNTDTRDREMQNPLFAGGAPKPAQGRKCVYLDVKMKATADTRMRMKSCRIRDVRRFEAALMDVRIGDSVLTWMEDVWVTVMKDKGIVGGYNGPDWEYAQTSTLAFAERYRDGLDRAGWVPTEILGSNYW